MKKMSAKEILIPAVSLFIICLVVTALLGVTNKITTPIIEEQAVQKEQEARKKVLSQAESFSDAKTVTVNGVENTYYEGLKGEEVTGYVFTTTSKGYGDEIVLMVGVTKDGAVAGIDFLNLSETAGLGMNAAKQEFKDQYVGKTGTIGVAKSAPKETEIQALTGATITSKAVTRGVNSALELYKEVKSNG